MRRFIAVVDSSEASTAGAAIYCGADGSESSTAGAAIYCGRRQLGRVNCKCGDLLRSSTARRRRLQVRRFIAVVDSSDASAV
ncbi:MAG: hypothetical protein SR1Q7_04090 [Quinella sp. 1Q7]|nr:hypothetical protein [Quinella sp. 1Q7]